MAHGNGSHTAMRLHRLELVDNGSEHHLDVAEMRLRDARVEQLEKRLHRVETMLQYAAVAFEIYASETAKSGPFVEVECPRCGLRFAPHELRGHMEGCDVPFTGQGNSDVNGN